MNRNAIIRGLSLFLLLCLLAGCSAPDSIPPLTPEGMPAQVTRGATATEKQYINISVDHLQYLPEEAQDIERFRLFVFVADDRGHSGGFFCPGFETIQVGPGQVFSPCDAGLSIPEIYPGEELYVMMVAVNESSATDITDLETATISTLLSYGLESAIKNGLVKAGVAATINAPLPLEYKIGLFALDVVIGLAGERVKEWFTGKKVVAYQSFLLRRDQNWLNRNLIEALSDDGKMVFSFVPEITTTATGVDISGAAPVPGLSKPTIAVSGSGFPSETHTPEPQPTQRRSQEPQGTIVFQCTLDGYQQVCIMDADGGNQRQLMQINGAAATYPSLSADGESVIFTSNFSGDHAIYEIDLSSMATRRISEPGGDKAYPMLSPRGDLLTYTDINASGGNSIFTMKPDGSDVREIYSGGTRAEFSPDGSLLAFICGGGANPQICIMKPDGSDVREISALFNLNYRVSWSPDGQYLTFSTGVRENKDRKIGIIDRNGDDYRVVYDEGNAVSPQFSPDGEWIVFANYKVNGAEVPGEIFIVRTDGSDVRRLTHNERTDWLPYWGK